jgi:putative hemolysin
MVEFFILLGLIVVNGVFAMSELAIVSARTARLQSKADQGDVGAKTVINLQADPSRFLSTVQIGITLVGIIAGAYGATAIADELSPFIATHVPAIEAEAGKSHSGL